MSFNKTSLPVGTTRKALVAAAKTVQVTIEGKSQTANIREFSTGSVGWNVNDKQDIVINGVTYKCQVGLNVTIIGTKELPKEAEAQTAAA
jgi:hypothetical protein